MTESELPVLIEKTGNVIILTLNRPQRLNAIDGGLVDGLHSALEGAMASQDVRAIILTGAGDRAFCAGDDLKAPRQHDTAAVRRQVDKVQDITRLIVYGSKPVIAAVNGWAVGGGLEWVMNCDLSLWANTAKAFMPEVYLGLGVTGAATAILPHIVGWQRARAMLLLGDRLDASQLLECGLAYEVTPPDKLMERARALAERIAILPEPAVSGLKRVCAIVQRAELEVALAAEADLLVARLTDVETDARLAEVWERRP